MSFALIATTEISWISTARMPSALRAGGFEVAVVAPDRALLLHSSHIDYMHRVTPPFAVGDWVNAVARVAAHTKSEIVLPGDDRAFRMLAEFVLRQPAEAAEQAKLPRETKVFYDLLVRSLGNPAFYKGSVDKLELPALANRCDVEMPRSAVVSSIAAAQKAAAEFDYPVLVKRAFGSGGSGVRGVDNEPSLVSLVSQWLMPTPDLFGPMRQAVKIQETVDGINVYYAVAAWQGELLAGWAAEKLEEHPKNGPGTVSRSFRSDAVRTAAAKLVAGLGMSGLFGIEFMMRRSDQAVRLIEINRRIAPSSSRGRSVNVDLIGALYAAQSGGEYRGRRDFDPGEEHIACFFPQEFARDPESAYLRKYPVEMPWDDPPLMLKLFESVLDREP